MLWFRKNKKEVAKCNHEWHKVSEYSIGCEDLRIIVYCPRCRKTDDISAYTYEFNSEIKRIQDEYDNRIKIEIEEFSLERGVC